MPRKTNRRPTAAQHAASDLMTTMIALASELEMEVRVPAWLERRHKVEAVAVRLRRAVDQAKVRIGEVR